MVSANWALKEVKKSTQYVSLVIVVLPHASEVLVAENKSYQFGCKLKQWSFPIMVVYLNMVLVPGGYKTKCARIVRQEIVAAYVHKDHPPPDIIIWQLKISSWICPILNLYKRLWKSKMDLFCIVTEDLPVLVRTHLYLIYQ